MVSFFRRTAKESIVNFRPMKIPLTNIQKVDEAGILYIDEDGNSTNMNYYDAYKSWCKSKCVKKSKPKYICDRTKSDGWQLIFYISPKIVFYADQNQEELWIEIINKIRLQGFAAFDWD